VKWLRGLSIGLLVLLVLAAAGGGALAYIVSPTNAKKQTLEVKPGSSISAIAQELERRGLIRNATAFRFLMQWTGNDRNIREGYYDFSGQQSAVEIARRFAEPGRPRVVRVTIPEGWRMSEIIERLAVQSFGTNAELETAFRQTNLLTATRGAPNLEGFLFPATYEFRPEDTAETVTKTMTKRLEQEFTPARLKALEKLGLSIYQWVTLASIVQAEAGNAAEMPTIAGVFLNRLEIGMGLQSDPTIAYGLGKKLPELNRRAGDFEKDTPYNTYKNRGLTPTPINNPGAQALSAVLNAQRKSSSGDAWLYFLHGRKGEFRVNTNFQAHLRDTDRFR
jgi:UPF0755 protein